MDIQFLVERIEALVVNGRKVPMTSQVILEQAAVLDLIDQLRVAIPEEVKQARRINQESDRVLSKAREEAELQKEIAAELAAEASHTNSLVKEDFSPTNSSRDKLITEYAPLIKYIAQKIAARLPANIELDDLISSGVIGLMDAIDKYDASRDNKFKTYAEFRIRGAILD